MRDARRLFAAGRYFATSKDVFTSPLLRRIAASQCVAAYLAMGSEPDVMPLVAKAKSLALPRINADNRMDFIRWQPDDPLDIWRGIAQPRDGAERVAPDLVLVPLVGFDRRGNRLGQGGGHYDRTLARLPTTRRIGIGWSIQEIAVLPAEPHDIRLDAILTEREWIVP
ncbi:MAG: 5-formyltetrahydrofolate cyclo-ligase [Alphaproteobacteria bacterium]|nr:5-formyltetrahydrofolate cyclo-ligase [Alphaproteobacteria bacterium]